MPGQAPVNVNASLEARQLLSYLNTLMDPATGKMLTGQHNWIEAPASNITNLALPNSGGKYPAVSGFEMGPTSGQPGVTAEQQRASVVQAAKSYWQAGGIPTFTWHINFPLTSYLMANVQRGATTQAEFDQCLTPGDAKYNWLLAEFDKVAAHFKVLRDAGVPILFRPFHQMNGYTFWWGKKNNFAGLWNLLYERLTTFHELNNILWVWSPNCMKAADTNIGNYQVYYPGHSKVDVLAWIIYQGEFTQAFHDNLYAFGGGKPIALGEVGTLPNMDTMKATQYRYVWALAWGEPNFSNENTAQSKQQFYSNAYGLTREKIAIPAVPAASGGVVKHLTNTDLGVIGAQTLIVPPRFVGQIAIANGRKYVGIGTSSQADWEEIATNSDVLVSSPSGAVWKLVVDDTGALTTQIYSGTVTPPPPPPPPPPGSGGTGALIFSDDFNRADSATTLGTNWTADFGTWGVIGNQAYAASNADGNTATRNTGKANYILSCKTSGDLADTVSANLARVVFRFVDVNNYLTMYANNGKLWLTKVVAGVETDLTSGAVGPLVDGTLYQVKISANGERIVGFFNDTQVIDFTLTPADFQTFGTASKVGMRVNKWGTPTTTPRWDEFTVNDVV